MKLNKMFFFKFRQVYIAICKFFNINTISAFKFKKEIQQLKKNIKFYYFC